MALLFVSIIFLISFCLTVANIHIYRWAGIFFFKYTWKDQGISFSDLSGNPVFAAERASSYVWLDKMVRSDEVISYKTGPNIDQKSTLC